MRIAALLAITLAVAACGSKNQEPPGPHSDAGPVSKREEALALSISAQDWEDVPEELAPAIAVQAGRNFFEFTEGLDLVDCEVEPLKSWDPQGPEHVDGMVFTSKSSLRSEILNVQKYLAPHGPWPLLRTWEGKEKVRAVAASLDVLALSNIRCFIKWAYIESERFLDSMPYLEYYSTTARVRDMRGLNFFKKRGLSQESIEKDLTLWKNGQGEEARHVGIALELLCRQFLGREIEGNDCLDKIEGKSLAYGDFRFLAEHAIETWDWLHGISDDRRLPKEEWELTEDNVLRVRVRRPGDVRLAEFFKRWIEEKWVAGPYKILVDWDEKAMIGVEIWDKTYFQADTATKLIHVSGPRCFFDEKCGSNMAHEFGHALGFKDLYAEFYDAQAQGMIRYDLDPENIMNDEMAKVSVAHFESFFKAYK